MDIINKLPTDIINKILIYVAELENDIIITQYNTINNNKIFKINKYSEKILQIKTNILLKKIYPIKNNPTKYENRELYNYAKDHYKKLLKNNDKKFIL